jgi:L-lysine 6-transaminase
MRDKFIQLGIKNNVMFLGCGNSTIRFRPALIIEKNNIDEGLHILQKIANKL